MNYIIISSFLPLSSHLFHWGFFCSFLITPPGYIKHNFLLLHTNARELLVCNACCFGGFVRRRKKQSLIVSNFTLAMLLLLRNEPKTVVMLFLRVFSCTF